MAVRVGDVHGSIISMEKSRLPASGYPMPSYLTYNLNGRPIDCGKVNPTFYANGIELTMDV